MIKIERTLTTEEELALSILGMPEQKLTNRIIQNMNSIIEDTVNRAKRKKVKDKTLLEISQLTQEI